MAPQPIYDPCLRECPSRQALDRIGDGRTILVVGSLVSGPRRYTEPATLVDGISQKMLTQTPRGLERDGLVTRTVFPVVPPHVEYEPSDPGRTLSVPIAALERWALDHMSEVLAARERYDRHEVPPTRVRRPPTRCAPARCHRCRGPPPGAPPS